MASEYYLPLTPDDRIVQRLRQYQVPEKYISQFCLADFVKEKKASMNALVSVLLPTDVDLEGARMDTFQESLEWLQWLMFEDGPDFALRNLSGQNEGGVCGTVWGVDGGTDIAYSCTTCAHDPTCAICVPCFHNGDHKEHDFTLKLTIGGCCDCGDVTAWKQNGFCSMHKGAKHVQPLSDEIANSVSSVLASLFNSWKGVLLVVSNYVPKTKEVANDLTSAVVEMLLKFCKHGQSLLCLIASSLSSSIGLLTLLLRAQRFATNDVINKLHELFLKLLGVPTFKDEFAKKFLAYYPTDVEEAIKECRDFPLTRYQLLSTFSVQIFTVPFLTLHLVQEMNLLTMLLGLLENIFISCSENGRLQVSKWVYLYETTRRVIEDIQYVMSHVVVSKYVTKNHQDILRTWLKLLSYVQGMNPQKREMGDHKQEENDNVQLLLALGHYIANIHSLFVDGAFSDASKEEVDDEMFWSSNRNGSDDEDDLGHANVGPPSQESSACDVTSSSSIAFASPKAFQINSDHLLPYSGTWMIHECLRVIENWLTVENASWDSFLSSPDWPEILYDVSSPDVSVHIPFHRFLSMLLQKALRRYFRESEVPGMTGISAENSSTIYRDFFKDALWGSPCGFSAFIMDNPLRIRVFCAEVHAGMWRKNGSEALLLCQWYRSVQWSENGLENDLFLLQCCAAFAPEKDSFVRRVLECFGLSDYLSLSLKRSSEYEHVLVQEMLSLIIQIITQRRFCGLTTAERLKRELIYVLSIRNATRSQLVKSLPCDLSKSDKLQNILDTVAAYSSPFGMKQGMYSLRSSSWKELDLYHPRWNSKDLQAAEERYLHFCSVFALTTQLPKWTAIYPPLKGISRIATCKVVMEIIRAVLFYAVAASKSAESRAPYSVLLPALHLLSLSLDICFQQKENSDNTFNNMAQIPIIAFSKDMIDESSADDVGQHSLLSLLVSLMQMSRKEENYESNVETGGLSALVTSLLKKFAELDNSCMRKLRELAPAVVSHIPECAPTGDPSVSLPASDSEKSKAARARHVIMEKIRAAQKNFMSSLESNVDSELGHEGDLNAEHDSEESKQVICYHCRKKHTSEDPISFLILLQKSRLVSFVDRGPPSQRYRSDKEHMPVSNIKEIDTNQNSGSLESTSTSDSTQLVQNAASELGSSGQTGEANNSLQYMKNSSAALGNFQLPDMSCDEKEKPPCTFETLEQDMYNSILSSLNLMNEDGKVPTAEGNSNVRISGSALTRKYAANVVREMSEISSASGHASNANATVESTSQHLANDGSVLTDCDGVHLSSCGHGLHQECLKQYLAKKNERYADSGLSADKEKVEFACPVCRRLANCVLPTLPEELHTPLVLSTSSILSTAPSADSNHANSSLHLQKALNLLKCAANAVEENKLFLKDIPLHCIDDQTGKNVEKLSLFLSKMYLPGKQDKLSTFSQLNHSVLMWDTLKYSLTSMEIAERSGNTSITPNIDYGIMIEDLKSSSGFILHILLKLVQKTRSKNSIHVVQRLKGVELFAKSICSGSHADNLISTRGELLSAFGMDQFNTDIWKHASDPVLAHDPFSTLMWVLFCLPHPFLSCEDSLLSLVHAFYMVAVTQAIILYHEKSQDKSSSESAISDSMITDINKIMGESGCASQYFVSNYFDPSVDIKDTIRRFSFPYLRRCALLWEILYSSIPPPFCDGENMSNRPWHIPGGTLSCSVDINKSEVTKIQELENMFKIPPLDVVLKDKFSRYSVTIWCHHFCEKFQSLRIRSNIHVTPAIPFKLTRLPEVYQDILESYIKLRCPECNSHLLDPALCLLCGRLCHSNWISSCRESNCQTHSVACGAGTGVFLLLKRSLILLQRSSRMTLWPSPYLDAFGEEDFDMRRGKPLFLNKERYAALTYMVASHGLHRMSETVGLPTND